MRKHIDLGGESVISEKSQYDHINPNHYKKGSKEVIDMMVDVWGREAVSIHCEITAFKYRMRLGNKPCQPIERDFEKALWYEQKAEYLRREIIKEKSNEKE